MLTFLRKHQRLFFVVITVAIVVSFLFFGTFGTITPTEKTPDRVVGKAVDGSEIKKRELEALIRLLSCAADDRASWQQGKTPNLLNDAFLQKDLFATGLAALLAGRFFEEIKPELEERLGKALHFRPYVHPHNAAISADAVWARLVPTMSDDLSQLRAEATPEAFSLLCKLYIDQLYCPPDLLKKFLVHLEHQQGETAPDPSLYEQDLSLFGFHSLEDWFGPRFVELCAQFLFNVSAIAKQKGYAVTPAEARTDLFHNVYNGIKAMTGEDKVSSADVDRYFHVQLQGLGLGEENALELWGRVMLFRRLFQDVGNAVFLDPLAYKEFQTFTRECSMVDLYELPEELRFSSFYSMLEFQTYLDAISLLGKQRPHLLSLPHTLCSIDEIEKRAPELIESRFTVEVSSAHKEALAHKVSLKETWDWQLREENWDLLKKEFPLLGQKGILSKEEKSQCLDQLDSATRLSIDAWSRQKIVDAHPEWVERELLSMPPKTVVLSLRSGGKAPELAGVTRPQTLLSLLRQAPLKTELSNASQESLNCFTEDKNHYHRIVLIERGAQRQLLPLREALGDGTLSSMLDRRLKEAYPEARRKEASFQKQDGSWKGFDEVKELVGRYVFSDLIKAIEENIRANKELLPPHPSLAFYAHNRLFSYVKQAKEALEKNPDDPQWLLSEGSLEGQWLLKKTRKTIERGNALPFPKEEMFKLPVQGWSSVQKGRGGELAFFQVLERGHAEEKITEKIAQGQQMLSLDAQRALMLQLLEITAQSISPCKTVSSHP